MRFDRASPFLYVRKFLRGVGRLLRKGALVCFKIDEMSRLMLDGLLETSKLW